LRLNLACYGVTLAVAAGMIVMVKAGLREQVEAQMMLAVAILTAVLSGWWLLTLYRVQQIKARLRELDEQAAALRLSNRLAAAQ
ncbi:hypothetical protein ABTE52_21705, partial [Acinetobacter baumannii]